jgi:hypothetical protein
MVTHNQPRPMRVTCGKFMATPGVLAAIVDGGHVPGDFIDRHVTGDWGNVSQDDWNANEASLLDGSRILSAYHTAQGTKLWVITEAADDDGVRSHTTLMLPDEY